MAAHRSIALRGYTKLQKLLREKSIDQREVEKVSDVPLATVNRILNKHRFQTVAHGSVVIVRAAIKELLGESFKQELFDEYDEMLLPAAEVKKVS